MKTKHLILIFSVLFLTGCGLAASLKVQKAFDAESMSSKPFKQELPFQYINGVIVIDAEIEGHIRSFILDTGATTRITKDFAAILNTEYLGKIKTFDSNNEKTYAPYIKLKKINIGGVMLYDMVASVSDLTHLNTALCLNVSGIIGANAMNKCVWQIDYQEMKITFTNQRDSLTFSGKEEKINFSAMGKGTPTISLYSNGVYWGDAIFDTGSNGSISLDEKYLAPSISFAEMQIYSFGISSTKIKRLKMTTLSALNFEKSTSIKNQIVAFEKDRPFGIIGNRFLQNYKVTIDWRYQEIFLAKYNSSKPNSYQSFGCSPRFINDNTVRVGTITTSSEAYKKGVRLENRVLSINGIEFSENVHENYCRYLNERSDWKRVELLIQNEAGDLMVELERFDMIEFLN